MHKHQSADTLRAYSFAFCITLGIVLGQLVVLTLADSLTLFGDMIHILSDALVYGGIVFVIWRSAPEHAPQHGKKFMTRIGIASLCLGALYVAWEGVGRIRSPVSYPTMLVMAIALVSIAGNVWAHLCLKHVEGDDRDVQYKNFIAHLRSDIAASAIVFISALGQKLFALPAIEGYLSLLLAGYMCFLAWHLFQESNDEQAHEHEHHHH